MQKVIFVGGFFGTKFDHILIKKILKDYELILFKYDTRLYDSIKDITNKLKIFIDNLKLDEKEKVYLIGLSAGGIICDYYLKFLDNTKVSKFVTIYSPFNGSPLPYLFTKKFKGLQDLKNNSRIINKLKKVKLKNIKIKSFWCLFDPIVLGKSGKYVNAEHCLFFIHSLIQFWPGINHKIKNFFD